MNHTDHLLQQIQEVDAPPFLLTRIHRRLQQAAESTAPARWQYAFLCTGVVLVLLHAVVLRQAWGNDTPQQAGTYLEEMHLSPDNHIYHE